MSTSNMRVRLLLDLVNRFKGPASAARRDLKGVADEAKALDRTGAGRRPARDILQLGVASTTARQSIKGVADEAKTLDRARAGRRLASELGNVGAAAGQARRGVQGIGKAASDATREAERLNRQLLRLKAIQADGAGLTIVGGRLRDARGRFVGAGGAGVPGQPGAAAEAGGVTAVATNARLMAGFAAAYGGYQALRQVSKELDFGRLMFEVEKATDESGEALRRREASIRRLALETGKTKEELARITADGAFGGVAKEDLTRFTEYAAGAMNAWGTSAAETGLALNHLRNNYQATQRQLELIGDVINSVADISASREPDLMEFLNRAGAQGRGLGITAQQMVALGAALKEVGVPTAVAATGVQALMNKLTTYDLEDEGFVGALKAAGINAKTFKRAITKDAMGSIVKLLEGLNKIEDPIKRMEAFMGLGGQEYADDFSRLAGGVKRLKELLGFVGNEANYAGSTMRQAAQAATKDFNKVDRATRAIEEAGSRIGSAVIVPLGHVAEKFNEIALAADKAREANAQLKASIEAMAQKQAKGEALTPEERTARERDRSLSDAVDRRASRISAEQDGGSTLERIGRGETANPEEEHRRLRARALDRDIARREAELRNVPANERVRDRMRLARLRAERGAIGVDDTMPMPAFTRSSRSSEGGREAQEAQARMAEKLAEADAQIAHLRRLAVGLSHPSDRLAYAQSAVAAEAEARATARGTARPHSFDLRTGQRVTDRGDRSESRMRPTSGGYRVPGAPLPSVGPALASFGLGGAQAIRDAFTIDLGEAGMTIMERLAEGIRSGGSQAEGAAAGVGTGVKSALAVDASAEGRKAGESYAAGLRSSIPSVLAASEELSSAVNRGLARAGAGGTAEAIQNRISGRLTD